MRQNQKIELNLNSKITYIGSDNRSPRHMILKKKKNLCINIEWKFNFWANEESKNYNLFKKNNLKRLLNLNNLQDLKLICCISLLGKISKELMKVIFHQVDPQQLNSNDINTKNKNNFLISENFTENKSKLNLLTKVKILQNKI